MDFGIQEFWDSLTLSHIIWLHKVRDYLLCSCNGLFCNFFVLKLKIVSVPCKKELIHHVYM